MKKVMAIMLASLVAGLVCADSASNATQYKLKIQKYLLDKGKESVDWFNDVLIYSDGEDVSILRWNLKDVKPPTEATLPSEQEAQVALLPLKYRKKAGGKWVEKTPQEKAEADAEEEEANQEAKPKALKQQENNFVEFLAGDYTDTLRTNHVINQNVTITPQNTTEDENIDYLYKLKKKDKAAYEDMAERYSSLSTYIEKHGKLDKAKEHSVSVTP